MTGPSTAAAAATALCAVVLLVLNAVAGFFVLNALLTEPEGSWDRGVTDTVQLMGGLGIGAGLVAAAVTAGFIALGRVRRWWYAAPAVLILTAVMRMVFAPTP